MTTFLRQRDDLLRKGGGPVPRPAGEQAFDDAALVRRSQEGYLDAFEQLAERHATGAYQVAYRLLADREAARDIAQESLLAAYRNLPRFRGDASFRTWLYRIVTNASINHLRRADHTAPLPADAAMVDLAPGPAEEAVTAAQVAAVRDAVAALPLPQRVPLVLCQYEGLSYEEIAAITQTSVPAVRSQLFRARRALARALEPWR